MIDFRPQPPEDDDHRSSRKAPPDYSSRRVQGRLMLMVFLFMFVIILIEQASDPGLYRWIWTLSKTPQTNEEQPTTSQPVARLPSPANAEESQADPLDWLSLQSDQDKSYQQTQRDLWEVLAETLTPQERQILNLTFKTSRDQLPLDPEPLTSWPSLKAKLDAGWKNYYEKAYLEVVKFNTDLSDSQKKTWLDVLQRSKDLWEGPLTASFAAIAKKQSLTKQQQQAMLEVQSTLDQLELEKVRDHTLFRGSEHIIWFRLFEKLLRSSPDNINRFPAAQVNFLQLDNQGAQYRGKLVTVSGQIRQGYRVRAPQNILGIKEYSVFTIKPNDGPEQPIIIYCLETPEGFPALPDKDLDQSTSSVREQASFTGYFFKSWVYKTKDSSFSAPLILARSPNWKSTGRTRLSQKHKAASQLTSRHLLLIITATLTGALLFTFFVYRRSRWKNSATLSKSMDQQAEDSLGHLPENEIGAGPLAALQALALETSEDDATDDHASTGDTSDS